MRRTPWRPARRCRRSPAPPSRRRRTGAKPPPGQQVAQVAAAAASSTAIDVTFTAGCSVNCPVGSAPEGNRSAVAMRKTLAGRPGQPQTAHPPGRRCLSVLVEEMPAVDAILQKVLTRSCQSANAYR